MISFIIFKIIFLIIFTIIFLMRYYTFPPSEGCTLSTSTQTCRQWPTKECNQSSSSSSFPSQIFWNCADFFKFENFPSDPGWPGGPGRTSTTTTASTRCSPYLQCRPARAGSRKFSLFPFLNVFFFLTKDFCLQDPSRLDVVNIRGPRTNPLVQN